MSNEALFLKLAEALARPSGAYRAANAALDIPGQALGGYEAGAQFADKQRLRKESQQSLRDVLGANVPERFSKVADIPQEQVAGFGGLRHLADDDGINPLDLEAIRDARQERNLAARDAAQQRALAAMEKRQNAALDMAGKRLALTKQGRDEKAQKADTTELDRSKGIIRTIDSALNEVGPLTVGLAGSVLKHVPATSAKNLNQTLLTVKANVGFEELQRMRQSSPTGGALGQVSDSENKLLQATRGSLDQDQSSDQLVKNLADMRKHYSNVIMAIESQTGDLEADDAIAQVIASNAAEGEKRARIQGIRAAAMRQE